MGIDIVSGAICGGSRKEARKRIRSAHRQKVAVFLKDNLRKYVPDGCEFFKEYPNGGAKSGV